MTTTSIRKLTPNLFVDAIEPCIAFWRDRLGFQAVAEVPEGDKLGFAILSNGAVELMYQTWASLEKDVPGLCPKANGSSTGLFIEVSDLDAVERALEGIDHVFPRRRTFYGMDEIGVREPGGHAVIFAQPAEKPGA